MLRPVIPDKLPKPIGQQDRPPATLAGSLRASRCGDRLPQSLSCDLDPGDEQIQRRNNFVPVLRQVRYLGANLLLRNTCELGCQHRILFAVDLEHRGEGLNPGSQL